ncbi:molecular chaperone [Diaphorobacter sp. HDW4A]|uniref:fimbrial biogenesis chaperone n=1 Tax=Diaphorobacter sp. HDW4A TaxID=2714924 RepID=UPI001407A88E|nr:fimbria/pilus periplasmic chaperone [Diaphorobacter sp. HDW4A]QIL81965.1 molecular chaperone [Diaphorobacter sp. HDW4A]
MALPVSAAGLEVSPTSLQIASRQSADGITLRNVGDVTMYAQVRVFAWSQQNNEDLLTPSTALSVSPPMVQIAPGTSQLLRVIRSSGLPPSGTEETYRLIIDEIPASSITPAAAQAAASGASNSTAAPAKGTAPALSFYMRYSLPVFLGDSSDAPQTTLTWSLAKSANEWTIGVINTGANRAQVADITAVLPSGEKQVLMSGLVGYVLAGQSRHWNVPAPASTTKIDHFQAMINRTVQPIHVSAP